MSYSYVKSIKYYVVTVLLVIELIMITDQNLSG